VARARPHLVARFVELDDAPEERRLELFDIRLEVTVDVLRHEVGRVFLGIDQAAHGILQEPVLFAREVVTCR
jgi:hypothetical protein